MSVIPSPVHTAARDERRARVRSLTRVRGASEAARRIESAAETRDALALLESLSTLPAHERDAALLEAARAGDGAAVVALYIAYLPVIEGVAGRYGSMSAAYDGEDAHQDAALALLEYIQSSRCDGDRSLASVYPGLARAAARRGAHALAYGVSRVDRDALRRVREAIDAAGGDYAAAARRLERDPEPGRRMSPDRFYALAALLLGPVTSLDEPAPEGEQPLSERLEDHSAASALAGALDGFDHAALDAAWQSLTPREREVIDLVLGLSSGDPMTEQAASEILGVSRQAVGATYRRGMTKLRDALQPRVDRPLPVSYAPPAREPRRYVRRSSRSSSDVVVRRIPA